MAVILDFRPRKEIATTEVLSGSSVMKPKSNTMDVLEKMLADIFDTHADEQGYISALGNKATACSSKVPLRVIQGGR